MRTRLFLMLFCCFYLISIAARPAFAGEYALIIGIDKYPLISNPLNNAVNDAKGLASKLKEIGFAADNIDLQTDVDLDAMEEAFSAFLTKLETADDGSVALFYFSGHGVEFKGRNFLIPSDIKGTDVDKLFAAKKRPKLFAKRTMVLNDLLDQIAGVRKEKNLTVIFIIDACRERPQAPGKVTRGLSSKRGLAPVLAPKGMFVMYSAGAGQSALDGAQNSDANGHSVYTQNLLKILSQAKRGAGPGLAWMAQEIREDVYLQANAVDHLQTPAYYDQFTVRLNIFGQPIPRITLTQQIASLKQKNSVIRSVISKRQIKMGQPFQDCLNCPEMMAIKGGSYMRGSPAREKGRADDEGPQARVNINGFGLSRFEISNHQWNSCVAGGGCKGEGRDVNDHPATLPVTGVSWRDANDYAKWLSNQTGKSYRLATEAEWEYAARAGSQGANKRYFFGNDASKLCQYGNGADRELLALFYANNSCSDGYGSRTAPVGIYRANNFKLHGMIGNVAEWVQDCYVKSYKGAPDDGSARSGKKERCQRVVRSGSWRSSENALRSAARNKYGETHTRRTIGLRIARDIDVVAIAKAQDAQSAQAKRDAEAKAQARAKQAELAQAKRDADAKTAADTLAQAKREEDARLEADAKATAAALAAKVAADKVAQAKLEAKAKAATDKAATDKAEKDKSEQDRLAQSKLDAKAKLDAEAKAKLDAEAKAETEKARLAQEAEKARLAALEKARLEAEGKQSDKKFKQLFTAKQVKRFSPRARKDLVASLVANQQYFHEAGITTPRRLVHFFTQVGLETGGLRRLDENMNYSKSTLLKVFSRRTVSKSKAGVIARKPKKVANWVYGARLGNRGRSTNDGWNYRGSGFIQLTGRTNFRNRGKELNLPLEAQPELARQPNQGLNAATAYWTSRNINKPADKNRLYKVRVLVNGRAAHGFKASKLWYSKAKKAFLPKKKSVKRGLFAINEQRQEKEDLNDVLNDLGFTQQATTRKLGRGVGDGSPLAAYQKSRGLPVTGKFDEDTLYAITDPREWRRVKE